MKDNLKDYESYCHYCCRIITASNIEEVENGEHDSYLFVHDDGVDHPNDYNPSEVVH